VAPLVLLFAEERGAPLCLSCRSVALSLCRTVALSHCRSVALSRRSTDVVLSLRGDGGGMPFK
jgi:hypothetical protein